MRPRPQPSPALAIALLLTGCSVVDRVRGSAGSGTDGAKAGAATEKPRTYYAGAAGMKVRREPSSTAPVVAELSRHDKVTRYRVERGWAYVTTSQGGVSGWVPNGQLLWRLPTTAAAPAPAPDEHAEPETHPPVPPDPEVTPEPAPEPPPPAPKTPRTGSSVFDPY